jgi:hypothetical protein
MVLNINFFPHRAVAKALWRVGDLTLSPNEGWRGKILIDKENKIG